MTERERLIELLKNVQLPRKAKNPYASLADYLLANGVTIPVRCEECKYLYDNDGFFICDYSNHGTSLNGYCHNGERRAE